jgi:hypothetical protein
MAELLSLALVIGPLRVNACLNWGADCDEAHPMLLSPPDPIDVPELDDDDLAECLGFRPRIVPSRDSRT